jgi:hypothetical protein
MHRRANRAICAIFAALLLFGCDSSSLVFSEADRRSMYTLSLSSGLRKLVSGSEVKPGEEIGLSLSRLSGSTAPAILGLVLQDADGKALATLNYATPDGSRTLSSKAVSVESLDASLPSFSLPATLVPGVYTLSATLKDLQGSELQRNETVFFVAKSGFGLDQVSLYPASPTPGSAVLLSVKVKLGGADLPLAAAKSGLGETGTTIDKSAAAASDGAAGANAKLASGDSLAENGSDPWLRWSREGATIAEGLLSKGFDKVVWSGAESEGAYSIAVDLYPAKPPESALAVASPWHVDVKVICAKNTETESDVFRSSSIFTSHIDFDGDFEDSGFRNQSQKPSAFGSPQLASYSSGFGYRLGLNAGLSLPGLVPPSTEGGAAPFSLLWRIFAEDEAFSGSADLVRFSDSDTSLLLRVGIDADRHPFVETSDASGLHRSTSPALLESGLSDLALSFTPKKEDFALQWSINGERSTSPSIPARVLPTAARAVLGGSGAFPAIYDEFALSSDADGRPALFRAAAQKKYRSDLVIAEGFEALALPAASRSDGTVSISPCNLVLEEGASLAFTDELSLQRTLAFDLRYGGSGKALALQFSTKDGLVLSVTGAGAVLDAEGKTIGLPIPVESGRLRFSLKAGTDRLEILGPSGLSLASLEQKDPPASVLFAFANISKVGEAKRFGLQSLLVLRSREGLSLAESARMARLK